MDKSEPALVPQWLKGTSGCGSGSTSHSSSSSIFSDDCDVQVSATKYRNFLHSNSFGSRHSDYDSPRNSTLADRSPSSSSRRGLSFNGGISDRANWDRAYSSFNRNSSFRGDRDRDLQRIDKEKEWERELDYRDKGQDRYDSHVWSSSFSSKYETEVSLKRSQSVILNKRMENGTKKSANELGSLTTPLAVGNIVGNINKAAFERNFPSLGSEDRQAGNHSNVTSNSSSNSIWHGQGTVGNPDIVRASSPNLTIATGSSQGPSVNVLAFGADGWSSALADAPVPNGASSGPFTSSQQTSIGSSVSSVTPAIASSSGLNMAEALVQNPPRVRTPPQLSIENQRLEELALKQSRQLIPMTPSMPKTTGFGPSEKLKPKMLRTIDTATSSGKVGQQIISPNRATGRPETPKVPQVGKLLVLKSAREKNGVSKPVMYDNSTPVMGGIINNMTVVSLTAGVGAVGNSSLIGPRNSKSFLDRKTMPVLSTCVSTGLDHGTSQRSKDNSLMNEEKKPLSQAQNRSDFFNTLRRKASGSSTEQKVAEQNTNVVPINDTVVGVKENGNLDSVCENSDNAEPAIQVACNLVNIINASNGDVRAETDTAVESSETGSPASTNMYSFMGGSEEEEAAFLRSLGWEENAGEEEALTEEEINAFYQQQMESRTISAKFSRGCCKFPNVAVDMRVGSLGSMSSEPSSSDSEPDCDS
ncbi:uncharacterized protein LOC131054543 isoform X2 [Cryptomeria japonica]|uniref:uncharacterized protein LOC131054543 isoform X2 n=1 Tax=Cryptomeria japonica TaxID=3369 RepID=UPI0027DA274D|nr:uncharacterized protein LOC131054543 isoform X2 [Cryptomeria japonica]